MATKVLTGSRFVTTDRTIILSNMFSMSGSLSSETQKVTLWSVSTFSILKQYYMINTYKDIHMPVSYTHLDVYKRQE